MCKLSDFICSNTQIWNNDRCRCECREDLIGKINCDKGYSWNPSSCECECGKSCNIGEYLDYSNCTCKKSIIDKLIDDCTNTIEENNDILVTSSGDTIYFSLFIVFLVLFLICSSVLIYFHWYKRKNTVKSSFNIKFNPKSQVNY